MLDSLKEKCLLYCYWLGDSLKRVLVIVSVSAFAISVAVFLYGLLYWAVLPSTALAIPVRFTFSSCDVLGEPCSYITSRVKLKKDKLQPGHRYNLELLLDVPDSQANRDVGMFLTCTRLIPEHPSQLPPSTSTCSSSVVPFKASLVSLVESVVLLPLHMAGLATSNSLVSISLLEDHQEDRNSPSTALELELQTSRLQIQAGVLKIWTNDLVGIRYHMYHHPKASMVMGVTSILTVLCLLAALALSNFLAPHRVVLAPSQLGRVKSNHDLADRQARARLNLEYREEVARRQQEVDGGLHLARKVSTTAVSTTAPTSVVDSGQRLEVQSLQSGGGGHSKCE